MDWPIRQYMDTDYETVVTFVSAIQDHERKRFPLLKSGHQIGKVYADQILGHVKSESGVLLLAYDNDKPIGMICGWVSTDDDVLLSEEARAHGYISDLYVAKAHRGRGLAKALIKRLADRLKAQGLHRLRVCSKASNIESMACYAHAGFTAYETIFEKPL